MSSFLGQYSSAYQHPNLGNRFADGVSDLQSDRFTMSSRAEGRTLRDSPIAARAVSRAVDNLAMEYHFDPAALIEKLRSDMLNDETTSLSVGSRGAPGGRGGGYGSQASLAMTIEERSRRFKAESEMQFTRGSDRSDTAAPTADGQDLAPAPTPAYTDGDWTFINRQPRQGPNISKSHLSMNSSYRPSEKSSSSSHRRVNFANEIASVHVYEKDNEAWVSIKFKRNKAGWVLAFLYFVASLLFDMLAYNKMYGEHGAAVFAWASLWTLVLYVVLVICAQVSQATGFSLSLFSAAVSTKQNAAMFLAQTILAGLLSISFYLAVRFEEWTSVQAYNPGNCVFPLLFFVVRYLRSEETFVVEWVCSAAILLFSFIATAPMFSLVRGVRGVFISNVVWLLNSCIGVLFYLALERTRKITDSLVVRMLPQIVGYFVFYMLSGLVAGGLDFNLSNVFWHDNLLLTMGIGALQMVQQALLVAIVLNVDIASVGAILIAKATVFPYIQLLFGYVPEPNVWFAIATGPIVILCIIIVIVASEKRTWIARKVGSIDDVLGT